VDITEILKLVQTSGLALVISGVVIYFAFRYGTKYFDAKFEELASKQQTVQHVDAYLAVVQTISKMLQKACTQFQARRVTVWEFHNGIRSTNGVHYVRMSNTMEACAKGVESSTQITTDLWVSHYALFILDVINEDYVIIDQSYENGEAFFNLMKTVGDNKSVMVKLTDVEGKAIGILGVRKDDINATDIENAMELAKEVSMVLQVAKKEQ